MSYGFDVWQTGNFDDGLFHPQFDLKWDFGNGFNVFAGVWMDVNSNADSSISDDVQEVDVWLGGRIHVREAQRLARLPGVDVRRSTPSGSSTSASPTTRS